MAQLEALRVKRLTLFAEPVLQLATSGYNAVAHNISYHMGDGLGQPATYALLGLKLASDAYTWSQSGPNVIAFRGTVRGSGPTYLGELLDVSKEPPYPVVLPANGNGSGLARRRDSVLPIKAPRTSRPLFPFAPDWPSWSRKSGHLPRRRRWSTSPPGPRQMD